MKKRPAPAKKEEKAEGKVKMEEGADGEETKKDKKKTPYKRKTKPKATKKATTAATTIGRDAKLPVPIAPIDAFAYTRSGYSKDATRVLTQAAYAASMSTIVKEEVTLDEDEDGPARPPQMSTSVAHIKEMITKEFGPIGIPEEEDVERPLAIPPRTFRIEQLFKQFPRHELVGTGSMSGIPEEKLKALVVGGQAVLPVSTATHETELLGAAGEWRHTNGRVYHFPPCVRGQACLGAQSRESGISVRTESFVGGGVNSRPHCILMQWMSPSTWARFLLDGVPPTIKRHCVLCMRYMISLWVMALNGDSLNVLVDPTLIMHGYCNLYDEPDGYVKDCMVFPFGGGRRYNGLVSPFAVMSSYHLYWYQDPLTGRPRVDQRGMVWQPPTPLMPVVGETLA